MPREGRVLPFTGTLTQGANDVQTLTYSADADVGSHKLTLGGVESGAIAFGSTAAQIQTILEAHAGIGAGNVTVTGGGPGTSGTPTVISFVGTKLGKPAGALTFTSATTLKIGGSGGTNVTCSIAATVPGVIGSYRGLPTDTVIIKTDGIGIAYRNTGTSNTPTWVACDDDTITPARNAWGQ